MFECVSSCADEIKQRHGNRSQTRPCRLSHESGIDLLFLGLCLKKIYCYSHASSPRNRWSQIRTIKLFNTLYTIAIPDPLLLSQYSHLLLVVPRDHQSIYNTYHYQHYHFLKWKNSSKKLSGLQWGL